MPVPIIPASQHPTVYAVLIPLTGGRLQLFDYFSTPDAARTAARNVHGWKVAIGAATIYTGESEAAG